MISVQKALNLILEQQRGFGTEEVPLLQSAGRVLAEPVFADRDFPPYNRVMMDGIAINGEAFERGIRKFTIENIQAAGDPQKKLENNGNCLEVMTGAILPANTDVVVPYEQCEIAEGIAIVKAETVITMQNVHLQGTDSKRGELLLEKWERITPAMIGIMASVGLSQVKVLRLPKITICSTGDELVDVSEQPDAHQVRRSNVYMLAAALLSEGIHADTVHLPDDPTRMSSEIASLSNSNDVVLFSGAVSKGKFDYLPTVLQELGMQQAFHTVAQRPGKPFLFGTIKNTLIFGFPGNPVSAFVCYHQFFKQWLHQCMRFNTTKQFAALATDVHFKPALSYHLLVTLLNNNGKIVATPITGSTSGDLVTLTKAEGIITLPPDRDYFKEGEVFELNLL
ncbi:molybdopterin molybdotransferase MoeA [Segetibacter aerophilus]|uniref:Molybdopterin molybdenumtransferase n=1 Tax=Segetibacter aerophilus TaxID=670293 RepID=A0A512BC84_9BACT|nr:molybdopterin molybdotransferase MoeA [Segetibacter aerophilus]GEO09579.1 molybdopterin molybdenumtransferase MoeA [Segetibacter aerophilus]